MLRSYSLRKVSWVRNLAPKDHGCRTSEVAPTLVIGAQIIAQAVGGRRTARMPGLPTIGYYRVAGPRKLTIEWRQLIGAHPEQRSAEQSGSSHHTENEGSNYWIWNPSVSSQYLSNLTEILHYSCPMIYRWWQTALEKLHTFESYEKRALFAGLQTISNLTHPDRSRPAFKTVVLLPWECE
uniref:Uncharacterized protein n=1 Tax=Romanomermis culicivorax TaxID=13658 RepID=A0A915I0X2_ROMCU